MVLSNCLFGTAALKGQMKKKIVRANWDLFRRISYSFGQQSYFLNKLQFVMDM